MRERPWLAPVAALYGAVVERRRQRAAPRRLQRPVISLGNLTVGGSGKTPLALWIAAQLVERGERPAILSRGYGRDSRGLVVVSRGEGALVSARLAGDEPFLLAARVPGAVVVCHERRIEAGMHAERHLGATLHLLDDGFQHFALARDLDVVLLRRGSGWQSARLLPAGPLREHPRVLAAASAVVMTPGRGDDATTGAENEALDRLAPGIPRFVAVAVDDGVHTLGGEIVPESEIAGAPVVAYSALADNGAFHAALTARGFDVRAFHGFRDHRTPSPGELAGLERDRRALGARWIATSEKDAVKLPEGARLPVVVPRMHLAIPDPAFLALVAAALAAARSRL